jgi:hypothetical protein
VQEVSSTAERAQGQLEEVRAQLKRLGSSCTKDVNLRMQIFKSRVRKRGPATPAHPPRADTQPSGAASDAASGTGAASGSAPSLAPTGADGGSAAAAAGEAKRPIIGGVMAIMEEYEVVETVQVLLTVDRYHEVMRGVLADLEGEVARLQALRDDVNSAFAEMIAFFGERPQGVKEQEWWGDVIKFLKAMSKAQAALQKERDAARALAEKRSVQQKR